MGRAGETLHFHQQWAGAFHGHGDGGTGRVDHAFRQKCLGRVGHFGQPAFEHLEDTHFGGGPETVLDRTQQAVSLEAVALQVEHRVHDVLQHTRPGDGALLGDVPDHENGRAGRLGQLAQARSALAHLADRPGGRVHLGDVDSLNRVDDQQVRFDRRDVFENGVEAGLGDQEQVRREFRFAGQPGRPHLDLPLGLFTRNVQHPLPGGHGERHLQHQGRFADAGIAAHQHDRAGHQAAAQHARKLADWDGYAALGIPADLGQAARGGATAETARGALRSAGFLGHYLLDHAVK